MASVPIISWQIDGGKVKTVTDFFFPLGSRITADGDCSHERKAMTKLDRILKSRDITLPTMVLLVKAFLLRSKHLLWLQSLTAQIFQPKKIKSLTISIVSPSISHEVLGPDAMILVFWMLSFKPTFSLSSFTFIKGLLSSSSLSAIKVVSSVNLRLLIFLPAILIPACALSSPAFLMMYSA